MGTRGKRYLVLAFALGALLAMVLASPAQAVTIKGGDATHRTAALNVLRSQPGLLAFVESVYPGFTVWIGYGGHAWEGRIDVNGSRSGKAFTDQVAHEFCHEIQRAADAAGGPPALSGPWRDELTSRGFGPETWVWGIYAPLNGARDPWEALAENLKRAYFSPYYTLTTTPNTLLAWLSRADMTAFLQENGIQP